MSKIQVQDKSQGKGVEVRILKEGRYIFEETTITLDVTKPKAGKNQVKIATIAGKHNGKYLEVRTVDMELVDAILSFSETNDTDSITLDAVKEEGSRYLTWTLVL